MSQNIRFRVHTHSDYEEDPEFLSNLVYVHLNDNPSEVLSMLMSMTTILGPIFNHRTINTFDTNDPIQIAIQTSNEEREIRRRENLVINVNSQSYNTTKKKFDTCSICTDQYQDTDIVSVLDCDHVYHTTCIKEWGHYHPSCPVCKTKIPTSISYSAR